MLKVVNSDLHNTPMKSGSVLFYTARWRTTIRWTFWDKSLCNGRNSLEMTIMVTFNPGTMKWPGPPEHVWSILSIVYNKLYLHSRGQSILKIFFKVGTNGYFCNCLDKFVGRMNSTMFTLVRTRQILIFGAQVHKGAKLSRSAKECIC